MVKTLKIVWVVFLMITIATGGFCEVFAENYRENPSTCFCQYKSVANIKIIM
ncbi:hypothetical protein FACS1894188_08110 [Clostridia bacterium]|nr:hypothetical protein FACS1894188_08110 [Clostridia bacterium]